METMTMPDAAFTSVAEEIASAKEELLRLITAEPERQWHVYELKTQARNGGSASAVALALDALIDAGDVRVEDDLAVVLQR